MGKSNDLVRGTLDLLIPVLSNPSTAGPLPSAFLKSREKCFRCSKARFTPPCTGWSNAAGSRPSGKKPRQAGEPGATHSLPADAPGSKRKPRIGAASPQRSIWSRGDNLSESCRESGVLRLSLQAESAKRGTPFFFVSSRKWIANLPARTRNEQKAIFSTLLGW